MISKGIAIIGSTTIDKILKHNISFLKLGGATTYSGLTYRMHGLNAYIVTNVALKDRAILKPLEEENITIFNGVSDSTTHFINYVNEDEGQQKLPQSAASIQSDQIIQVLPHVDFVHLGPLHPYDIAPKAIQSLTGVRQIIVLDAQGYVRKVKNQTVYPDVSEKLSDALLIARVVKANKIEFNSILKYYHMNLDELMTSFQIEEFIVTMGENGGFIKVRDENEIHFDAVRVKSMNDPTGAGDVFLAAYVADRIFQNQSIRKAGLHAAKIAAQQVEGKYIRKEKLALKF